MQWQAREIKLEMQREQYLLALYRTRCRPVAEQKKNGENYICTVQSLRKEKERAGEAVQSETNVSRGKGSLKSEKESNENANRLNVVTKVHISRMTTENQ